MSMMNERICRFDFDLFQHIKAVGELRRLRDDVTSGRVYRKQKEEYNVEQDEIQTEDTSS